MPKLKEKVEFYNEQQKNFYLNSLVNNQKQMITIFKNSAICEESINKDLCKFTFSDFLTLFNQNNWCNLNTYRNRKSRINHYLKWCVDNAFATNDVLSALKALSFTDISKNIDFDKTFFKSFDELNDFINNLLNCMTVEQKHNSQMSIAVLYLLWIGFKPIEIYLLKNSDFDFENKMIKDVKIDNDIILNQLHLVQNTNWYYNLRGNAKDFTVFNKVNYLIDNTLIKINTKQEMCETQIKQCVYSLNTYIDNLDVFNKFYSKKLLTNDVYLSGLFCRIKKIEDTTGIKFSAGITKTSKGSTKDIFNKLLDNKLFTENEITNNDNKKVTEYKFWKQHFYYI